MPIRKAHPSRYSSLATARSKRWKRQKLDENDTQEPGPSNLYDIESTDSMDAEQDAGNVSSDKENGDTPLVSRGKGKGKAREDYYKAESNRMSKKAGYWEGQAKKERERNKELQGTIRDVGRSLKESVKRREEQSKEMENLKDKNDRLWQRNSVLNTTVHTLRVSVKRNKAAVHRLKDRFVQVFGGAGSGKSGGKVLTSREFDLKNRGVITDATRDVLSDLVSLDDVPENKVVRVFKRIAGALGVTVKGSVDRRSVGRIVKEGGNASQLQFMEAIKDAQGITLSGDGTTHKNEGLEAKHATINTADQRLQFFLGIKSAVNHASETQKNGWIDLIEEMYQLAIESGQIEEQDARKFWCLVTGFHSDHAEDQKKLFRLLKEYKAVCDRDIRGEDAVKRLSDHEFSSLILRCSLEAVERVGGADTWDTLSQEQRNKEIEVSRRNVIREIGEVEYEKLSQEEKQEVDLFLWAGCCMHKEMNAFKAGCLGLKEFWQAHPELVGPVKMYNRDNAATVELAPDTAASARAEERTEGGAIKVSSLAGSVFRHKDRKRGQQDTLRFFFDHEMGFIISFPDTSNTRFQSHAEACAVLITYLELFIKFLGYVKENKASRSLNHMENNVWRGLHCTATRHEACVITLYWLSISVPYMREIRGPYRAEDNVLLLGQLHTRLIAFIDALIADPTRLIGPDASYQTGSFDGKQWERPEAFYAVQRAATELPHLKVLLVWFLRYSREGWVRFSAELVGGTVVKITISQADRAWMEATNDFNEGAFAIYRQLARRNPTMTLTKFNSRQMYKFNGTSDYLRSLGKPLRQFLRRYTREQDESGATRRNKLTLAAYKKHVAEEKIAKSAAAAAKKQAKLDAIDAIIPITSQYEFDQAIALTARQEGYLSVPQLDLELQWHARHGPPQVKELIPGGSPGSWGPRAEKIKKMKEIFSMYGELGLSIFQVFKDAHQDIESGGQVEESSDVEVCAGDLEEFYDSEDDYYT